MNNSDTGNTDASMDVAIIGMAGRWAQASTIEIFWQHLCAGIEAISLFSDEDLLAAGLPPDILAHPKYVKAGSVVDDIDCFDATFFGYSPREAELLDPQQRLFLECAWQALEHAGYDAVTYTGLIGVFAGSSLNTYLLRNLSVQKGFGSDLDFFQLIMHNDKDFLPTRVSYKLNLRGPSINVQSACSTSLMAVHLACQSLLTFQSDMVLAGGVSLTVPQVQGYLMQEGGFLSPDGHCRSFDAKAQGTLNGNGLGIVVLKRFDDAVADGDTIYAVIKGSAVNNDGSLKLGYTAPSIDGQAAVIDAAHTMADIAADTISYIEAHGTATPLGDPVEVAALTQVFRRHTDKTQFCALGSVKTNLGHLDAAAGITSLIKTALALHHRQLPPSLHFQQPNPQIDFAQTPFYVNTHLQDWPNGSTPRRAGVSSFGIGGTNVHVVLEEAPHVPPNGSAQPWQLLVLSAKTKTALDKATSNLERYLAEAPTANLADVAYTLQVGRHAFNHRRAIVCRHREEAHTLLAQRDPTRILNGQAQAGTPSVVFMFPGVGVQYHGMGREIYQTQPVFRQAVDRCLSYLQPQVAFDIQHALYDGSPTGEAVQKLNTMLHSFLSIFITEYALAQLWMSWGVQPAAFIGHSLGEYTAAHLAGSISLRDVLALVELRGRLMDQLEPGMMLNVSLSEQAIQRFLEPHVSLAALNSPRHSVVAGPKAVMEALEVRLEEQAIPCRRLTVSAATHSSMLTPIVDRFAALARTINVQQPTIPYISNVTGAWITAQEWTNPEYWVEHLQRTVQFSAGMAVLLQQPAHVLLEVGPGQTLSTLTRAQPDFSSNQIVVPSMRHPQDPQSDVACLLTAMARLWLAGVTPDWPSLAAGRRQRIPLPTYPFEYRRHWIEPTPTTMDSAMDSAAEELNWFAEVLNSSEPTAQIEAAPSFDDERPPFATEYVAPTTPMEENIARLWNQVLGVNMIGAYDNFFELGGDSVLALQVAAGLSDSFGINVPIHVLFEAPTIRELAAAIHDRTAAPAANGTSPTLVRLQPQGSGAPFFCAHPIGGMANVYAPLARLVGTDRPFYGIQARGLEEHEQPRTSIVEMAQSYLDHIQSIQAHGPYYLGGWSMGGTIAFEIARQLVAQGESIALLALIDTPAKLRGAAPNTMDDLHLTCSTFGLQRERFIKDEQDEAQIWHAILLAIREQLGLSATFSLAQLRHLVHTCRVHANAVWEYVPATYDGNVTLLRARDQATDTGQSSPHPYDLGWGMFVTGSLTICDIDGTHNTMLAPPALQQVADHVRAHVRTVQATS